MAIESAEGFVDLFGVPLITPVDESMERPSGNPSIAVKLNTLLLGITGAKFTI